MSEHFSRVFLLSHMRAYTSLAGHILGTNPAINGYFEMHLSYEDASALDNQLVEFRKHEALKENSHYLFDKLLHNDYAFVPERLGAVPLTILVALRQPGPTIKSIVALFSKKAQPDPYAEPEQATRYYIERLEWLAAFCRTTEHPYYYFDTELFKAKPQALLSALSDWLELEQPLSEHYETFSQTGRERKGDSSEFIRSGKIDRTGSDYAEIRIPPSLLQQAEAAYQSCRQQIIDRAAAALTL